MVVCRRMAVCAGGVSPFPAGPSAKRQRLDGPGSAGRPRQDEAAGGRTGQEAVEENPRFRERERRRNGSDDDE